MCPRSAQRCRTAAGANHERLPLLAAANGDGKRWNRPDTRELTPGVVPSGRCRVVGGSRRRAGDPSEVPRLLCGLDRSPVGDRSHASCRGVYPVGAGCCVCGGDGLPDDSQGGASRADVVRPGDFVRSNPALAERTPIAQTQRSTAAGVKGVSPPCRRRHFRRGTVGYNGCPLCGSGAEDSPLAPQSPRVGEGASSTVSAFGHDLLQISLDGQASGGQGEFFPLHSLTRVPLDPVELAPG